MTYIKDGMHIEVKDLGDYIFKPVKGLHILEPNEVELNVAIRQAKEQGESILYVYVYVGDNPYEKGIS